MGKKREPWNNPKFLRDLEEELNSPEFLLELELEKIRTAKDREMTGMLAEQADWDGSFDDCPAHGGIECEQPCPCQCNDCAGSDEDIEGTGDADS